MVEKLFSPIEKILHRAEDHIEEWRRQYQARNAEAEADRDKLWAEAKEREKLLAKAIGEEEARRASVGEGTERHRFVFVVHSEEVSRGLVTLASERYHLVNAVPGGRSNGEGVKGSWLVFEASE
jgi:hypothetical protein